MSYSVSQSPKRKQRMLDKVNRNYDMDEERAARITLTQNSLENLAGKHHIRTNNDRMNHGYTKLIVFSKGSRPRASSQMKLSTADKYYANEMLHGRHLSP